MDFHLKLVRELVALDRRESAKRGYNHYALALYIQAAEDVTDAQSFTDAFTPSRGMHTVAKKLKLGLDVQHGQWVTV